MNFKVIAFVGPISSCLLFYLGVLPRNGAKYASHGELVGGPIFGFLSNLSSGPSNLTCSTLLSAFFEFLK